MARLYTRSPRQVDACIPLHPGELCQIVCQDAMLKGFTEEELEKIEKAVSIERQDRPYRNNKEDANAEHTTGKE